MRFGLGLVAALAVALLAAGVVTGERPEYEIKLGEVGPLEVGAASSQTLTIAPLRGRRISRDGPLSIDVLVDPPAGLELPRPRLRLRDAVDPEAQSPRFEIPLLARAAGSYRLEIDVRFWICARRTCRPVRERRAAEISVIEPPPPADAGTPDGADPTPVPPDPGTSSSGASAPSGLLGAQPPN